MRPCEISARAHLHGVLQINAYSYPQVQVPQPVGLPSVVAAAGLGQTAADQVSDGQQRDQEPALVSAEPLAILVDVDDPGGDQDTDDRQDVDKQLGGLERRLCLPDKTAIAISVGDSTALADDVVVVGGASGHASPFGECVIVRDASCPRELQLTNYRRLFRLPARAFCDLHPSRWGRSGFLTLMPVTSAATEH